MSTDQVAPIPHAPAPPPAPPSPPRSPSLAATELIGSVDGHQSLTVDAPEAEPDARKKKGRTPSPRKASGASAVPRTRSKASALSFVTTVNQANAQAAGAQSTEQFTSLATKVDAIDKRISDLAAQYSDPTIASLQREVTTLRSDLARLVTASSDLETIVSRTRSLAARFDEVDDIACRAEAQVARLADGLKDADDKSDAALAHAKHALDTAQGAADGHTLLQLSLDVDTVRALLRTVQQNSELLDGRLTSQADRIRTLDTRLHEQERYNAGLERQLRDVERAHSTAESRYRADTRLSDAHYSRAMEDDRGRSFSRKHDRQESRSPPRRTAPAPLFAPPAPPAPAPPTQYPAAPPAPAPAAHGTHAAPAPPPAPAVTYRAQIGPISFRPRDGGNKADTIWNQLQSIFSQYPLIGAELKALPQTVNHTPGSEYASLRFRTPADRARFIQLWAGGYGTYYAVAVVPVEV